MGSKIDAKIDSLIDLFAFSLSALFLKMSPDTNAATGIAMGSKIDPKIDT